MLSALRPYTLFLSITIVIRTLRILTHASYPCAVIQHELVRTIGKPIESPRFVISNEIVKFVFGHVGEFIVNEFSTYARSGDAYFGQPKEFR